MNKIKIGSVATITIIAIVSVTAIAAFFYGRNTKEEELEKTNTEITSQIVVNRISDQYFVVTKSVFLDEKIEIKISENSEWSNVLWKKEIIADALVRVDIGVDMSNIDDSEVSIDENNKTITIVIPTAEILDSSLYSDLDVETKTGFLASISEIFKDGTEDYNRASNELIQQAETELSKDFSLFEDAQIESTKLLALILKDTGYTIEFEYE